MSYAPEPGKDGLRRYGTGYNQRKEDCTRCIQSVREAGSRWPNYWQCVRKRGHGPDGLYRKQHDPAAQAARDVKSRAKYDAEWQKRRKEIRAENMYNIIKQIADGHNDARGLAAEFITDFDK